MPESAILTKRGRVALFAAPLLLVVCGITGGGIVIKNLRATDNIIQVEPPDGAKLFQKHCAYCHGPRGDGKGIAGLSPTARAFGLERFRFSTTTNGMPNDEDLTRLLKHGIPGSAMPSFEQLDGAACAALIAHVRQLARAGIHRRWLLKELKTEPDDPDLAAVAKKVEPEMVVYPSIPFPTLPPMQSLMNGKKIFDVSCAQCHGKEGKGDGPQDQKTDEGVSIRPRDLTTGMYKGGGRDFDLYARIVLGVPGTPMPATTTLSPQDMADLIGYVRSFVK